MIVGGGGGGAFMTSGSSSPAPDTSDDSGGSSGGSSGGNDPGPSGGFSGYQGPDVPDTTDTSPEDKRDKSPPEKKQETQATQVQKQQNNLNDSSGPRLTNTQSGSLPDAMKGGDNGSPKGRRDDPKNESDSTNVNVDSQQLGVTTLGASQKSGDTDTATVVESGSNGQVVPGGTDNDTKDGSSPGGGAGEARSEIRAGLKGILPDKKGKAEATDKDADKPKNILKNMKDNKAGGEPGNSMKQIALLGVLAALVGGMFLFGGI